MIRCAKLARDRGLAGPVHPAAAYFREYPPIQMSDFQAYEALKAFIPGHSASP